MTKSSLERRILNYLRRPTYQPLRRPDLSKALRLHVSERPHLRQTLLDLQRKGQVICLGKNRWTSMRVLPKIAGTIRTNEKGFGLLTPDDGGEKIYISPSHLKCALHEDRVMAELFPLFASKKRGARTIPQLKNREGRVIKILERRNSEIVGLLCRNPFCVVPNDPRFGRDIRVTQWEKDLEKTPEDHQVVVQLHAWIDPFKPLTGTVIEDIGPRGDPNVDMQCILRTHGFHQDFSKKIIAEAETIPKELRPKDYKNRRDLRDVLTVTIDPKTARDFDDAISLESVSTGWTLRVHIADVAYFVEQDSIIDKEAMRRGNSIYLVDRVVMMLPTEFTTRICSLNPNVDRLAHTVEISLSEHGEMIEATTYRSVICSDARLDYDQVQALFCDEINHGIPAPAAQMLRLLGPLTRRIRERRIVNGSLEINTPPIQCLLDSNGKVTSIEKGEAKKAYQLIEECMLLANIAVARKLKGADQSAIHRIHENPSKDQWAQMGAELRALGIDAKPLTCADINAVLKKIAGTPVEYPANLAILRNLKRAAYSAKPNGHFGLAFKDYVHFTSPIRRYPDLVVHRLLNALETNKKPPYQKEDIEHLATQCTNTETEADAAEKESIALRRVEYYNTQLQRGETGPHGAYIVKIIGKGLIVELANTLQRGLIPFASMTDDRYEVNATKTCATGQHCRTKFKIGDVLKVDLIKVDEVRRLIDFHLTGQKKTASSAHRKKRTRQQTKRNKI